MIKILREVHSGHAIQLHGCPPPPPPRRHSLLNQMLKEMDITLRFPRLDTRCSLKGDHKKVQPQQGERFLHAQTALGTESNAPFVKDRGPKRGM